MHSKQLHDINKSHSVGEIIRPLQSHSTDCVLAAIARGAAANEVCEGD